MCARGRPASPAVWQPPPRSPAGGVSLPTRANSTRLSDTGSPARRRPAHSFGRRGSRSASRGVVGSPPKSTRPLKPWLSYECFHPGWPAVPRHPARSTSGTGIVLRSERSSAEGGALAADGPFRVPKVVVVDGRCRRGRAFFTAYRQLPHSTSNSASSSRAFSIRLFRSPTIRLAQRRTAGVRWSANSRMGSVNCS